MNQFQSNLFTHGERRENIENYCNRVITVSLGFNSSNVRQKQFETRVAKYRIINSTFARGFCKSFYLTSTRLYENSTLEMSISDRCLFLK